MYEITKKYGRIDDCFGLGKDIKDLFGALDEGLDEIRKYLGSFKTHTSPDAEADNDRYNKQLRPSTDVPTLEKELKKCRELNKKYKTELNDLTELNDFKKKICANEKDLVPKNEMGENDV